MIPEGSKNKALDQLEEVAEKGSELREEWEEEKQNIIDQYDAEIVERDPTFLAFIIDGEHYSTDWMGEYVTDETGGETDNKKAQNFADEYTTGWQDKIREQTGFIEEETYFRAGPMDEAGLELDGTGFLNRFKAHMSYLATSPEEISVYYMERKHLGHVKELQEPEEETVEL